jgi:hypothetical protein
MVIGKIIYVSTNVYDLFVDTLTISQIPLSVVPNSGFQIFMFSVLFMFAFLVGAYVGSNS